MKDGSFLSKLLGGRRAVDVDVGVRVAFFLGVFSAFLFETSTVWAQKIYFVAASDPTDSAQSELFYNDVGRLTSVFFSLSEERCVVYGYSESWQGPTLFDQAAFQGADGEPVLSKEIARFHNAQNFNAFERLRQALANCPATSDDALVVYWSGHGGFDSGEHFLTQASGERLARRELRDAAKAVGARLTILLTDSCADDLCSKYAESRQEFGVCAPPLPGLPPLFEELTMNYRGVLDVNSCSQGERAYSVPIRAGKIQTETYSSECRPSFGGGCFSLGLASSPLDAYGLSLSDAPSTIRTQFQKMKSFLRLEGWPDDVKPPLCVGAFDVYSREAPSWDEFLNYVETMTNFFYRNSSEYQGASQPKQTVARFETPERIPGRPKPRFRVPDRSDFGESLDEGTSSGSDFGANFRWSSSAIYHPEAGDRVVAVNGSFVDDEADWRSKIADSPSTLFLTVVDARSGKTYYLRTTLRPRGSASRLGLFVEASSSGGVRVVGSEAGSPARLCRFCWRGSEYSDAEPDLRNDSENNFGANFRWSSSAIYHPEAGDRVVAVNGTNVVGEADWRSKIADSPSTLVLTVVDARSGKTYYLRTTLRPRGSASRLGLFAEASPSGGVRVVGSEAGSPARRCQFYWAE